MPNALWRYLVAHCARIHAQSAATTVAIAIPQVETVFSFIGASCSSALHDGSVRRHARCLTPRATAVMLVFAFPGIFYLITVPPKAQTPCVALCCVHACFHQASLVHTRLPARCSWARGKAWALAIGGSLLCPLCLTILTLQQTGTIPA